MNPADGIFDRHAGEYDAWFEGNFAVYAAQVNELRAVLPPGGLGLEIGTGTGRFASRLGIQHGLDPTPAMLDLARKRGIEVVRARGESLPYRSGTFDVVLMMTVICFMDDFPRSFQEAFRVLVSGGTLVVAFLVRDGEIARREMAREHAGRFLRSAVFRSVAEVAGALKEAGFSCVLKNLRGFCLVTAWKM